MVEINWSLHASERLDEIISYLNQNDPIFVPKFLNILNQKILSLNLFPRRFRQVPELQNPSYREIIIYNYRIIYSIKNENYIEILTIIHSRQSFWLD